VHSSRLPEAADRPLTSLLLGVLSTVRFMEATLPAPSNERPAMDGPCRRERSRSRGDSRSRSPPRTHKGKGKERRPKRGGKGKGDVAKDRVAEAAAAAAIAAVRAMPR